MVSVEALAELVRQIKEVSGQGGIHYFRGEDFEPPKEFDLRNFPAGFRKEAEGYLRFLTYYVRAPAIVDGFQSGIERDSFLSDFLDRFSEVGDFLRGNRLKANNLGVVPVYLKYLAESLPGNDPRKKRLKILKDDLNEEIKKESPFNQNIPLSLADKAAGVALETVEMFVSSRGS